MYINEEVFISYWNELKQRGQSLNTFTGLILCLIHSEKINSNYYKININQVSKQLDKSFTLKEDIPTRNDQPEWWIYFHPNWISIILSSLLKGNKLPIYEFAIMLYWYKSFNDVDDLKKYFTGKINNNEIIKNLFIEKSKPQFLIRKPINRSSLKEAIDPETKYATINFNKKAFLAKNAGDLTSAPFGQTIYANSTPSLQRAFILTKIDLVDHYKILVKKNKYIDNNQNRTLLPKPFILLAGISGTGKTRFVREQAKYHQKDLPTYCLVPVRPDWHEPSDLLGYISRIGDDGTRYIVTDFLRFMVTAWKEAFEKNTEEKGYVLKENPAPYWLCLDEMNLAPVEQYFADYLSIIETREWRDELYFCDAILANSIFSQLNETGLVQFRNDLGLQNEADTDLWNSFTRLGIALPPNLIVAGTVNMDETTHGFSRKVIDRAFTLDFGLFFPNDYQEYFTAKSRPKCLGYPNLSQVTLEDLELVTADQQGILSIQFLEAINAELKGTPFELAFRALNELLISLVCFKPEEESSLQAVWDDFLMTKILPRIEGDSEKLQDDGESNLLKKLEQVLVQQLNSIWGTTIRPDLLRESIEGESLLISCRSKQKLAWMQRRLSDNGFTSFWP